MHLIGAIMFDECNKEPATAKIRENVGNRP
jgi:hypothetical protein